LSFRLLSWITSEGLRPHRKISRARSWTQSYFSSHHNPPYSWSMYAINLKRKYSDSSHPLYDHLAKALSHPSTRSKLKLEFPLTSATRKSLLPYLTPILLDRHSLVPDVRKCTLSHCYNCILLFTVRYLMPFLRRITRSPMKIILVDSWIQISSYVVNRSSTTEPLKLLKWNNDIMISKQHKRNGLVWWIRKRIL
jgi:hypothetical protein